MPFVPINRGAGRLFEENLNRMLEELFDLVGGISAADVSNSPSGNLVATDVQAALNELQTELDGVGGGLSEYLVPIWAEEAASLSDATYEWAFGNGANTPANNGIAVYVPSGMECHIVAMSATTDSASGSPTIEASVNGTELGVSSGVEVTLAGRSGTNDSFTPYALSDGDRLAFRTRLAGTNGSVNTVTAWLRYRAT